MCILLTPIGNSLDLYLLGTYGVAYSILENCSKNSRNWHEMGMDMEHDDFQWLRTEMDYLLWIRIQHAHTCRRMKMTLIWLNNLLMNKINIIQCIMEQLTYIVIHQKEQLTNLLTSSTNDCNLVWTSMAECKFIASILSICPGCF